MRIDAHPRIVRAHDRERGSLLVIIGFAKRDHNIERISSPAQKETDLTSPRACADLGVNAKRGIHVGSTRTRDRREQIGERFVVTWYRSFPLTSTDTAASSKNGDGGLGNVFG